MPSGGLFETSGAMDERGHAVAAVAREALAAGPMGRTVRAADYRAFLATGFAVDTPQAPVYRSGGTHCAIFARCCLSAAFVLPLGKRPRITGITSWLGLGWFSRPVWIPYVEGMVLEPGDIFYWSGGNRLTWLAARNGHVGVAIEGTGHMWITAEGGGGPDGSTCRMSPAPKDIRLSNGRPLRGVWRVTRLPGAT